MRPRRFIRASVLTLIEFILQKDGRSQGEGQGPQTKSSRKKRVRLDKTGGAGRYLYAANTGENQDQVLGSQCTYPRGRPIDGHGGRLTILPSVCIIVHWCYSSWRLNTYIEFYIKQYWIVKVLLFQGMEIGKDYRCLYLVSVSCLEFGSNVLCSPSSVLLTASLAPIIGLRTAIGTARTTARTGPWRRMSIPCR